MASMATTTSDYQATLNELSRAIRSERDDCPPREVARLLLSYHAPGHSTVVGIGRGATQAVLYHEVDRYAISVGIHSGGLDTHGREIADFTRGRRFDEWIQAKTESLDWVHPEYRGVD